MAKVAAIIITSIVGVVFLVIGACLVHFCTLTTRTTLSMDYFENLFNGSDEDNKNNYENGIKIIKVMEKERQKKNSEREDIVSNS